MAVDRKILFVINPKAGTKSKESIPDQIASVISNRAHYKLMWWEKNDDIKQKIKNEITNNTYDVVAAIGGDGTMNMIGSALVDTPVALAIIPIGSGNGLARHLKIPLNTQDALNNCVGGKIISIDSCQVDGKTFFCTCGVGFDAHISKVFAQGKKRGFFNYVRLTVKEFFKYHPNQYILTLDGKEVIKKAFLITFANANQFGNEAIIAPLADIQDGILEVTILKKINLLIAIGLAFRLFNRTIHLSKHVEIYKAENIVLSSEKSMDMHYDGEPDEINSKCLITIKSLSLKVVIPQI